MDQSNGSFVGLPGEVSGDAVELSMSELLDDADGYKDSSLSKFEWLATKQSEGSKNVYAKWMNMG